jgi:hypothetical protein
LFNSFVKITTLTLTSFAVILTIYKPAFAQLNVGHYGIQQGLEVNYLHYQLSRQDLSKMRGISECTVGFSLNCNKTGTLLQHLLELNHEPNYYNLLMQAAGGEENFRRFASFYGNNPHLQYIPYASFWRNNSPFIMDSYQYLLGEQFSNNPVEGLALVTKNFYWGPLEGRGNLLDLRSGLLNLKYSFGRLLLEKVSKIPNLEMQLQSLGLSPQVLQFYEGKVLRGLNALSTKDEKLLQQAILNILSIPYSSDTGVLGRPNLGISNQLNFFSGLGIEPSAFEQPNRITLAPEQINFFTSFGYEIQIKEQGASEFRLPLWALGGSALVLLVLLLGTNSSSDNQPYTAIPDRPSAGYQPNPGQCSSNAGSSGNGSSDSNQIVEIPCDNVVIPPGKNVEKVLEPSLINALLLLIALMYILNCQRRSVFVHRHCAK